METTGPGFKHSKDPIPHQAGPWAQQVLLDPQVHKVRKAYKVFKVLRVLRGHKAHKVWRVPQVFKVM
jgi:hypothetical protein